MSQGYALQRCFEFTLVNLLGAAVGAICLGFLKRKLGETKPLSVLGTFLLSSLASAFTSTAMLYFFDYFGVNGSASETNLYLYQKLFLGVLIGSLAIIPLLFSLFAPSSTTRKKIRPKFFALMFAMTCTSLILTIYLENRYLMFFLYLPALVSAMSLDRRMVYLNSLLCSITIMFAANLGLGTFTDRWTSSNIVALQILLGSLALISIELAAIIRFGFRRKTVGIILGGWIVSSSMFMILYQDRDAKSKMDFAKTIHDVQFSLTASLAGHEKMLRTVGELVDRLPEVAIQQFLNESTPPNATTFRSEIRFVEKKELEFLTREVAFDSSRLILYRSLSGLGDGNGRDLVSGSNAQKKSLIFIVDLKREFIEALSKYQSEIGLKVTDGQGLNVFTSDILLRKHTGHVEHDYRMLQSSVLLGSSHFNMQWEHLDPSRFSSNVDLAIIGALGALLTMLLGKLFAVTTGERDVAEQESERYNQRLLAQLKLWKVLTENAPVGIFQMNNAGDIVYSNPLWESYVGNALNSPSPADRWALIYPEDRESTRAKWIEALISDRPFEHEYRIQKPNGEILWMHVIASQIHDDTGELEGIVGIATNISDKKRQEAALQQERIRNIQASKMANLGEMAAGVAHEINNPLALINATTCGLKLKSEQFPEDAKESINIIEKTALRIAKIVKGLLAFSRNADADPLELSNVSFIVEDTLALCRQRLEKNDVTLRASSIEDSVIDCRPIQISQILVILLNNAFDAVEGTKGSWVEIEGRMTGSVYTLSVRNSGDKIPLSVAQKIFDPFFTTKIQGKGIGLGLSIAQGLAADHGGSLELNEKASLTEFVLSIPCGQQAISA